MGLKNLYFLGTVLLLVIISTVQSAPNNSTDVKLSVNVTKPEKGVASVKIVPTVTVSNNSTKPSNKTADSEEDCEPEPEPETAAGAKKNATTTGDRQGKQLTPVDLKDKDKYKAGEGAAAEPEPVNEHVGNLTAAKSASKPGSGGDAEKLQGNSSSTTAAPSSGGSSMIPSLWANVIFATLLTSFTYSAL